MATIGLSRITSVILLVSFDDIVGPTWHVNYLFSEG